MKFVTLSLLATALTVGGNARRAGTFLQAAQYLIYSG